MGSLILHSSPVKAEGTNDGLGWQESPNQPAKQPTYF